MARALYICYFGIREPLVETQVLPYLRELVKIKGLRMSIVTFEPSSAVTELQRYGVAKLRDELAEQGIDWHWLRYHKWPSVPATAWDVLRGSVFVWQFMRRNNVDLLHARVHLPMLMAALARKFSRRKPKILFDIRGFFPEEYTDAGRWPEGGWLYRTAKRIERWLMKEADGFVVLTEKARGILFPESAATGRDRSGRPVELIPCCIDPARFSGTISRAEARKRLKLEDRFVVAYVGSFGGWYLTDAIVDFFAAAREHDPTTYVMVLTQGNTDNVRDLLLSRGFARDDLLVKTVEPQRLGDHLVAADVAVSFIKSCYSKLSSSPTKVAEYLACGLPIVVNRGVGDVTEMVEANRVGAVIDGFERANYIKAIETVRLINDLNENCRETADRLFDIEKIGGPKYRLLYNRLLGKDDVGKN